MDVGIQRMNDRLALAAHEPATWLWLAASIAAIAVYGVAVLRLTPWNDLESWLGLAAGVCVVWILFGWMVELLTLDARGHLSFILGWEYPVLFAFALALAMLVMWRPVPRPKPTASRDDGGYHPPSPEPRW